MPDLEIAQILSGGWIGSTPVWLAGIPLLAGTVAAAFCGYTLRSRVQTDPVSGAHEGIVISAVLGLLALLLGFTYSLAIDRFEARRELVLREANAIGTTYLRAQLLDSPHRGRISELLMRYTDNRIALGKARAGTVSALLAINDRLLTDLWAAEAAAFDKIKALPFSSSSMETMNNLIDLDTARKAARTAHVPNEAFLVIFIYFMVTAGIMGYTLTGFRGRLAASFLLVLFMFTMILVFDIDRPTMGGIRESQAPMEWARAAMSAQPPRVFDRYREN